MQDIVYIFRKKLLTCEMQHTENLLHLKFLALYQWQVAERLNDKSVSAAFSVCASVWCCLLFTSGIIRVSYSQGEEFTARKSHNRISFLLWIQMFINNSGVDCYLALSWSGMKIAVEKTVEM